MDQPGSRRTPPEDPVIAGLRRCAVVPVIVIDDVRHAEPLAEALSTAGLSCAEITLRTDAALPALRAIARHGGLLVGAGTVLSPDQVEPCLEAGAGFVVSPGYDPEVVETCRSVDLTMLPGTATASEVLRAWRDGLTAVKFFPAEQIGGIAALEAIAAAVPDIAFLPTGGITHESAPTYLASPRVLAVGGGWIAPRALIADAAWDEIRARAARAASLASLGSRAAGTAS
jgi:2-dehydro-3-deoxyphosphogluconate aldolase / (4S)-4-hydroxy-2-oxoglutarate aldolase